MNKHPITLRNGELLAVQLEQARKEVMKECAFRAVNNRAGTIQNIEKAMLTIQRFEAKNNQVRYGQQ